MNALKETNYSLPGQTAFYRGKVRDVYTVGNKLVMVATDRISAFDHILPRAIPCKGQVLNQIAVSFLENTKHLVPNWLLAAPDANLCIGKLCKPFKVEMVIRAYLSGHAWRQYKAGERVLCGEPMPDGMRENDVFPNPIITPTTKADEGHDLDISKEEIIKQGIVSKQHYELLESYTRVLFKTGSEAALKRGLILVDTKYEFGLYENEVTLMDEIHTPDSSRYFYADTYHTNQQTGIAQKHLSKEFVRQWLIANGFQGLDGQRMPNMPDEVVDMISKRYIELFEQLTGKKFEAAAQDDIAARIEKNILKAL